MRSILLLFLVSIFTLGSTIAQPQPEKKQTLPKVFVLGSHENQYNNISEEHSTVLLSACGDDMDVAFNKWLSMLKEMEAYANLIDYDIKGVKLWLNIFWEKDGSLRHIAFHLKPNSRNVALDELTAFLSSFMNHYKFPLAFDQRYSHYGSASFPIIPRRLPVANTNTKKDTLKKKSLTKD